jgi:hypothetical protein
MVKFTHKFTVADGDWEARKCTTPVADCQPAPLCDCSIRWFAHTCAGRKLHCIGKRIFIMSPRIRASSSSAVARIKGRWSTSLSATLAERSRHSLSAAHRRVSYGRKRVAVLLVARVRVHRFDFLSELFAFQRYLRSAKADGLNISTCNPLLIY